MVESAIDKAIRRVEGTAARGGSYEELVAALDACSALPAADNFMPTLLSWRITATMLHNRSAEECEVVLIPYLALDLPVVARASKLLAVCATWPELVEKYLPDMIVELEAAPESEVIREMLDSARQL